MSSAGDTHRRKRILKDRVRSVEPINPALPLLHLLLHTTRHSSRTPPSPRYSGVPGSKVTTESSTHKQTSLPLSLSARCARALSLLARKAVLARGGRGRRAAGAAAYSFATLQRTGDGGRGRGHLVRRKEHGDGLGSDFRPLARRQHYHPAA